MEWRNAALSFCLFIFVPFVASAASAEEPSQAESPMNPLKISEALPNDVPVANSTIHARAFLERSRSRIKLGITELNGDKMLKTRGANFAYQYFFSEQWGAEAGAGFYSTDISQDMTEVRAMGVVPIAYDPKAEISLGGIYQPTYGKILLWDYIQHFKIGLRTGITVSQQEVRIGESVSNFQAIGPYIGLQATLPVSADFSVNLQTSLFMHGKNQDVDLTTGIRRVWSYGVGIGYLL